MKGDPAQVGGEKEGGGKGMPGSSAPNEPEKGLVRGAEGRPLRDGGRDRGTSAGRRVNLTTGGMASQAKSVTGASVPEPSGPSKEGWCFEGKLTPSG